jgi:hydrogenase maturation factor
MSHRLPPGKVPWEIVADLVQGELPAEVKLGPRAGEDAALVEIGGELWAIATDPISFTAADAGRLSVFVNANDVAVRGAEPRFFLVVGLIAPHEASQERVTELLTQVREACREVGCVLIGGHTEVTPGLPHSLIVGTMLGPVHGPPLTTGGLREGDWIGMTRYAGLEGTAIRHLRGSQRASRRHRRGRGRGSVRNGRRIESHDRGRPEGGPGARGNPEDLR